MSTIKCPECNLVNWASDPICKRCGVALPPMDPMGDPVAHFDTPVEPTGRETPIPEGETAAFPPAQPEWNTVVRAESSYQTNEPVVPKPKFGLALFSMIAGIIGIPPFSTIGGAVIGGILAIGFGVGGFIAGLVLVMAFIPAGLIAGIVALKRSNRLPKVYGGKGFAIAGIICSSIALVVLPVIAAIAIPNLMASRRAANEGAAVSTMRKLASAEDIFTRDMNSGYCADIKTLVGVSLIDPTLEKGEKSGYRYNVVNFPTGGCEIHASPMSSSTGNRSFYYSTKDGVLRAAAKNGKEADKYDPPVQDPFTKNDELPAKIALEKSR